MRRWALAFLFVNGWSVGMITHRAMDATFGHFVTGFGLWSWVSLAASIVATAYVARYLWAEPEWEEDDDDAHPA